MTLLTIESAAAQLAAGTTSSAALVEESLAAIDRHQAATNAFTRVDAEGARAAAVAVDRERAQGMQRGPLHGVPISLKDLIDEAGVVTSAGSRVLRDRVAPADAPVVTRLRQAGAVIIGRTNLHEFALGTTSEDSAFGPVHHPRDHSRSAGGSSGGSAAAVATGMGLASIGTDTGGSIRIPASVCGVVGLKPSLAEVPTEGVVPLSGSFDHVGPLARSVQDASWLWAVLTGRPPAPVTPRDPRTLRFARVGGYFDVLTPEVREAFDRAVGQLRDAGVSVQTVDIGGVETISKAYVDTVLPEAAEWHARYLDSRGPDYTPTVRTRLESGRLIPAVDYLAARGTCGRLRAAVDAALGAGDALLLPTLPIVAPRLGEDEVVMDDGSRLPVRSAMLRHTQLFNMTGHPAISLPIASAGLPVGLQLVGRLDRTGELLAVAAACERVLDGCWAPSTQHPAPSTQS
jgi:aspartyl-tRNA(Asn)/glutamyl-tRNA(Gln) amidotransferase subunit A